MKLVALDFETYYDAKAKYSLKSMTTEEYVRDPRFQVIGVAFTVDNSEPRWVPAPKTQKVLELLDLQNCAVLAHNAAFDMAILNWRYGIRPKMILDTMSMGMYTVGIRSSTSLASLSELYGLGVKGTEVLEADGKRFDDFTEEELAAYGRYCCNDVALTRALFKQLRPHIPNAEMRLIDWTIRAFSEPKLELDTPLLEQANAEYNAKVASTLARVGISDIGDLRSDEKFAAVLRKLGVEPPTKLSPKRKDENGDPKVVYAFSKQDEEFMDMLECGDEPVEMMVDARLQLKSTIAGSRLQRFLAISKRGPLPVPLLYCGAAATKRWSGTERVNLQNLPRNTYVRKEDGSVEAVPSPLRRAIKAPPGRRLAVADLSQIELRVNAWQSGQNDVLELLKNNGDVYCDQASALAGREITKKNDPVWRFIGKTTELQCGYQCGWRKFQHSLVMAAKREGITLPDTSDEFCESVVYGYRRKRDKISALWKEAQEGVVALSYGTPAMVGRYKIESGKLFLPNGSFLYYPDLSPENPETLDQIGVRWRYTRMRGRNKVRTDLYGGKLVENITQAVARLFMADAILRLLSLKMSDGSKVFDVVNTVHDEVIATYDPKQVTEQWVHDAMTWAMTTNPDWAKDIPLACEVETGENYAEAK